VVGADGEVRERGGPVVDPPELPPLWRRRGRPAEERGAPRLQAAHEASPRRELRELITRAMGLLSRRRGGQPSSALPGPRLGAASAAGPGSQKPLPDAGGRRPGRPEIVDIGGGSTRLGVSARGGGHRGSRIAGRDNGRGLRRVGARIAGADARWGRTRTRGGRRQNHGARIVNVYGTVS
jgi:hypothetical protein